MSIAAPTRPTARSATASLFGRVMGLVALTVACATFGVWVARDSGSGGWFIAWLVALGCLFGLNAANARGRTGLAVTLLLAFGVLIGVSVAGTVNYYAATDPTAVRQAFAATTLSVAALGTVGYATRRDLSFLYRILFWLLLAAADHAVRGLGDLVPCPREVADRLRDDEPGVVGQLVDDVDVRIEAPQRRHIAGEEQRPRPAFAGVAEHPHRLAVGGGDCALERVGDAEAAPDVLHDADGAGHG